MRSAWLYCFKKLAHRWRATRAGFDKLSSRRRCLSLSKATHVNIVKQQTHCLEKSTQYALRTTSYLQYQLPARLDLMLRAGEIDRKRLRAGGMPQVDPGRAHVDIEPMRADLQPA